MCFRGQEAVTWIEEPPLIDEMEKGHEQNKNEPKKHGANAMVVINHQGGTY